MSLAPGWRTTLAAVFGFLLDVEAALKQDFSFSIIVRGGSLLVKKLLNLFCWIFFLFFSSLIFLRFGFVETVGSWNFVHFVTLNFPSGSFSVSIHLFDILVFENFVFCGSFSSIGFFGIFLCLNWDFLVSGSASSLDCGCGGGGGDGVIFGLGLPSEA